jgi:iron complex outermembrane receptor protein
MSDIIPPAERANVFGRAMWRAARDHVLFTEIGYSRNTLTTRVAPTAVTSSFTPGNVPILYPADGPYYPTAFAAAHGISGDLDLIYRTLPLGARVDEITTSAWRAVAGADGSIGGWTYSSALTYSRNRQSEDLQSGYVSVRRSLDALATGLINPFGPAGPVGDALLAGTQLHGVSHWATGSTIQFDVRGAKDVYALPAGPLAIAVGAEARRERFDNEFADFVAAGDVMSGGGEQKSVGGRRTAASAFVEAIVPVAASVEAQLAVRHDHYDDFGGTTNPKLALRWQPSQALLVRGSWGTGFRAPALYDLHTPLQFAEYFTGLLPDDPVRCPVTHSERDCRAIFVVATGGNPNLQPERSRQFSAGIVVEPARGLSLTTDYWKIDKKNFIGTVSPETIFANFAHYEPTNVVRGVVDPAYPDLPGPIDRLLLIKQNLGHVRTSGIDVGVAWRGPATPFGRFEFKLDGTWLIDWRIQPEGLDFVSGAGRNDAVIPGPFPRWRHYASLDWTFGPWSASLAQTFQSGYEDRNIVDLQPQPSRRVAPYEVWHVQGRYTGIRNATMTIGVKNLMDRAPPFTNAESAGWDPKYADPRGRSFYARLTYAFK